VQPRFAAAASGVDMEMEKALALIRKTRGGK
jgi:hypothetical protein